MPDPEVFVSFHLPIELSGLLEMPWVVHLGEGSPPAPDALWRNQVRALVTNGIRGADAGLIGQFPKLELIASLGIGLDAIDLAAARQRGIVVTNTPGVTADDVADLALAMLTDRLRNIRTSNRFLLAGQWHGGPFPLAHSLYGRTVGIVGLGSIGLAIAQRAQAHRLRVQWTGPRPKPDAPYDYVADLTQLARNCDVLVVCCAGGSGTRHLISAAVLQALGPEGILINVARGAIVDTPALIHALQTGQIAGAALDVYEDQPRVPDELLSMEQVLLTPHLGSATRETRARMGAMVIESLADHFAGRTPQHRVV